MAEEAGKKEEKKTEDKTSIEEMVADAMSDNGEGLNLEAVYQIPVQISVVLGKTAMPINQLIKLGRGAVIELDRKVGEAVDIFVNDRLIAKGEVVIVEDKIGITMTEIIKAENRS